MIKMIKIRQWLKHISDALFPKAFTCDICGIETFGNHLCEDCLKNISFNDKNTCPVCGRKTVRPEICLECKNSRPLFQKATSPLIYDGGTVRLIAKFKNGNGYLKDYLSDLMVEKLNNFPSFDVILYVPMTRKAKRKRGYNQAELLAKSISEKCGVPYVKNAVIKMKDTREQKKLTRKERAKNLEGCFKVEKRTEIKDKDILLVDDVLTTGATADSLCKKLIRAGAKNIYFITVASVEFSKNKENDNPSIRQPIGNESV